MNYLQKRKAALTPKEARALESDIRQKTAFAVSIAAKKAEQETIAAVLETLKVVVDG